MSAIFTTSGFSIGAVAAALVAILAALLMSLPPAVFAQTPSNDATLSALTVSPQNIIGFASDRYSYEVGVASTVTQVTVAATKNDAGASVEITPGDTDSVTAGHQVTLSAGRNTVTITVTAEDSSTQEYTVNVNQGVTDPFGWKASEGLDGLIAAQNENPSGMWSNGTTMWLTDNGDDKIYAYRMSDKARDASKDFNTLSAAGNNNPSSIWSNGATMWVADGFDDKLHSYNMPARIAPYGYPIQAQLNVGQDLVGYMVDTHTRPCRQCFFGQAFVVNFENNRVYLVEVDTALDSKDPRLNTVQVMDFEGWNLHNGTKRQDRFFLPGIGYHYSGGQTNTIVDTRHWAIGGGDFFVYTRVSNGYDEASEEYRIRVRGVTGGSVRAASGTVRAVEEPQPLAAAFAPPLPDSHGGSAFTMWLGFTEEVQITEKTLRAALSVSGGQLTSVAQRDAGYNRSGLGLSL